MSGLKRSNFRIVDAEQQRRADLLDRLAADRRNLFGLSRQMQRTLDGLATSVRAGVSEEEAEAWAWLRGVENDADVAVAWDFSSSASALAQARARLEHLSAQGRAVSQRLEEAVVHRVARLRDAFHDRLAERAGALDAQRPLIRQWLGEATERQLENLTQRVGRAIDTDTPSAAEELLRSLESSLTTALEHVAQREAERVRHEQARRVLALHQEVETCRRILWHRLGTAGPGLQETFATEVEQARRWAQDGDQGVAADRLERAAAEELRTVSQRLEAALAEGRSIADRLRHAFSEEAARLREQATMSLSAATRLFDGAETLLRQWCEAAEVDGSRQMLGELTGLVQADRCRTVEQSAARLQAELQERITHCEGQEALHRRRLYLLTALRQVCQDLGFAEVGSQHYERAGDRRSRIVYTVDTRDHGPVTFHLALDTIEADSCVSKVHCASEFDQLSDHLRRQFGIQSRFEGADGTPLPLARTAGALEEPTGGSSGSASGAC